MIRKRKDKNQRDIIKALKQIGCKVYDLSNIGEGVPDLLIATHYMTILAECKNKENWYGKKEAHYTTQKTFRETWNGGLVLTFYSPEDAVNKITKEAHYTTQKTFRETWNGGLLLTFYSPQDAVEKVTKETTLAVEAVKKIDMMIQLSQK